MTRACCALVLLLSLASAAAAEEWYQAYDAGLKAIEARQWAAAEAKLKLAIQSGPKPGRQVRKYGFNFVDRYVPAYQLGLVYFEEGRLAEAVDQLRRAESAGVLTAGDPEYATLRSMLEQAQARLSTRSEPTPSPAVTPSPGGPTEEQREAEAHLREARQSMAREQLAEARRSLEAARAADPSNAGIGPTAESIGRLERQQQADAEAKTVPARDQAPLDKSVEGGRRALAAGNVADARKRLLEAQAISTSDPRVAELQRDLEFAVGLQQLEALVKARNWVPAQRLVERLSGVKPGDARIEALASQIAQGRSAKPTGSEDSTLRAGVRAFFEGRYGAAIDLLQPLADAPTGPPRARFFLACAHVAAGFLSPAEADHEHEAARRWLTEARRQQADWTRELGLVSPRIREFYRATP